MSKRVTTYFILPLSAMLYILLSPVVAYAQSYQYEANGVYNTGSSDFGDVDGFGFGVSYCYFLRPVDATQGPFAERAFVDKAANVALGFGQSTFSSDSSSLESETDTLSVSGRFVTVENFIATFSYAKTEPDNVDDSTSFSLGFGKYLDDRTAVVANYSNMEVGGGDLSQFGIFGRQLSDRPSNNAGTYLATEAGLNYLDAENDSGYELLLGATYYTSVQFGLGGGFSYRSIGDANATRLSVDAEYFLSPQLAVAAGFSRNDTDFSDTDNLSLSVTGRF